MEMVIQKTTSAVSSLLLSLTLLFPAVVHSSGDDKSLEEAIPITMANIRGHKALYNEGWFVVTSTDKALKYAHQHSIVSSGEALKKLQNDLVSHSSQYANNLGTGVVEGYETGKRVFTQGTERTSTLLGQTHQLAKAQLSFASEGFANAWDGFIQGNISLVERTQEDRDALLALPGNYFSNIKNDFSNVYELAVEAGNSIKPDVQTSWSDDFNKAAKEFNLEYERSGEAGNSLGALFYITWGYMKAAYYGLFKPSAETLATGVTTTVSLAGQAIFLPVAGTLIITGRTVQAIGQTLYYTTKTGYKIISPTLEAGLLASLSLVSAATTPVTYAAGTTVGVINQVAITTAAPVATAAQTTITTTRDTLKYAGLITYDLVSGTSRVVVNQVKSGVVLGYNALTALPTQLIMGTTTVFFLAWDGANLVIASISSDEDVNNALATSVAELPVGSVVDLEKMKSVPGIKVDVTTEDPEVINAVMEKLPHDLRH